MKRFIFFLMSLISTCLVQAVQKDKPIITFSSKMCEKGFPARISSYTRRNMMACKIEDLRDNSIAYTLYKISERENLIFIWPIKENPRTIYKTYENSYKIQQKKLKKHKKTL